MLTIRNVLSFLRWRVIAVRYITWLLNLKAKAIRRSNQPASKIGCKIASDGYHAGPKFEDEVIEKISAAYLSRRKDVSCPDRGAPFIDLMCSSDFNVDNPIFKMIFSKEILDVAIDYFGGDMSLYSLQVIYSFPTEGEIRESQKWHKDYGDNKTLHSIIYLSDVCDEDDGPVVFTDKNDSKRIKKYPFIRRIEDSVFERELDGGKIIRHFGKGGSSFFVDPAVCYHFGSRGRNGRLALFFSFNTGTPFVGPTKSVKENVNKIYDIAKAIRPDLSESLLSRIIGV